MDSEISLRRWAPNPYETLQIVLAIGINDTQFYTDTQQFRVTPEDFSSNLSIILHNAISVAKKVQVVGLTPVEEAVINPAFEYKHKAYFNNRIKEFEDILAEQCEKENVPFLPLFDRLSAMPDWNDHLHDGLHPNTRGHAVLAEIIGDFLLTDDFFDYHRE